MGNDPDRVTREAEAEQQIQTRFLGPLYAV